MTGLDASREAVARTLTDRLEQSTCPILLVLALVLIGLLAWWLDFYIRRRGTP